MKNTQRIPRRRGFTLVELLVVIAIIAVLAGLGIAVISRMSAAGKAATTVTNMKQIHGALTDMASEGVNTGMHAPNTFPPYEGSLQSNNSPDFLWWDLVGERLTYAEQSGENFKWSVPYEDTVLQNPLSKKKLGANSTFDSLYNNTEDSRGGFAYNAELGDDVSSTGNRENAYVVTEARLEDGATTIYFGESDDSLDTPGWVFDSTTNAPQGNHKDGAHVMFVDGHSEHVPNSQLKDPSTFEFLTVVRDKNYSNKP